MRVQHVSVGDRPNSPPINVLNSFIFATAGSEAQRGINADTFLIFKEGMTPEIDIVTSGDVAGTVICTLSGYHR